eukprot:CAMPEP_0114983688 /NCGR_PEP_ID=MMETSP0216-20121206/6840_1 /TAXON_ID=223996 /ORGANISM="Protocruzia adherens, Strain Boccale" /LENGTH=104 /DNA_ID=CAMNT_0002345701 /DNA_START=624 /DNA_END=935 /DNA_ORIENTATION=-
MLPSSLNIEVISLVNSPKSFEYSVSGQMGKEVNQKSINQVEVVDNDVDGATYFPQVAPVCFDIQDTIENFLLIIHQKPTAALKNDDEEDVMMQLKVKVKIYHLW